jgi:hypothetical protein
MDVPASQAMRKSKDYLKQKLIQRQFLREQLDEFDREIAFLQMDTACGIQVFCIRCRAQVPYSGAGKRPRYCTKCRQTARREYKHKWDASHREKRRIDQQKYRDRLRKPAWKQPTKPIREESRAIVNENYPTKCPQCGGLVVMDYDREEASCESCGEVIPREGP